MSEDFYYSAEDSYFLAEIVKNYLLNLKNNGIKKIKVLDLGTGSGIQAKNCLKCGIKKQNITASDINLNALKQAKKLNINIIKSNLFSKINNKYNLIIFNPPYLSEHKYDKMPDTTGGKSGDEIIIKFIKALKKHLSENGIAFLLTSSLTPENRWKQELKKRNLKIKKVAEKNLFFEKLYVWELSR